MNTFTIKKSKSSKQCCVRSKGHFKVTLALENFREESHLGLHYVTAVPASGTQKGHLDLELERLRSSFPSCIVWGKGWNQISWG